MSEHDEQGLSELERQLDQAFATTRPRGGFEDELWSRLEARRPWRWRLRAALRSISSPALAGALAALLVVVIGAVGVTALRRSGTSTGSSAPASSRTAGPLRSGASAPALPPGVAGQGTIISPEARLPGLPPPTQAGVVEARSGSALAPLPAASVRLVDNAALPQPASGLAVYRYGPAAGPADGVILEVGALPRGLASTSYPSRPPADAFAESAARESGGVQRTLTLTQARLVYVAVVAGGQGYLEPAYLFTGTLDGANAQLLVPALAPSAYR